MLWCLAKDSDPAAVPGQAGIHTYQDMLRAFRFPRSTPGQMLWLLLAFLFILLLLLALNTLLRRRKAAPSLAAPKDPGQKRQEFRVSMDLMAAVLQDRGKPPLTVRLCDLSAGGAAVLTSQEVPSRTLLRLCLQGEEGDEPFRAEIVRSEPGDAEGTRLLHCRFVHLTSGQEQHLRRLVAARERELLRNR